MTCTTEVSTVFLHMVQPAHVSTTRMLRTPTAPKLSIISMCGNATRRTMQTPVAATVKSAGMVRLYIVYAHNTQQVNMMSNITLSVPEELRKKMEQFPEINWSEVAKQAIKDKTSQLEFLKYFAAKSKMTEKDALELGKKVNKELAKRYRELV